MVYRTIFMTRRVALVAVLLLSSGGCSRSDTAVPPAPANDVGSPAQPTEAAAPNEWTPWRADELAADEFVVEEGFHALTFDDFTPFFAKPPNSNAAPTWRSVGRAIVCRGQPKGYLFSRQSYADFTLRLEWRFAPPADGTEVEKFNPNTGVLLFITEPHKQWPKSLEVQGRFAELGTIKPNGGAANVTLTDDPAARESARKPASEWNTVEIVSMSGALTVLLNGQKVCESQPGDLSAGPIGLQSEDFEVHFRRIRLRAD